MAMQTALVTVIAKVYLQNFQPLPTNLWKIGFFQQMKGWMHKSFSLLDKLNVMELGFYQSQESSINRPLGDTLRSAGGLTIGLDRKTLFSSADNYNYGRNRNDS
ncbi:MAG: hypothetical protein KDJ38_14035 [Gammaproteobacteria bacterium]|nr:hypothetical protein [Gammaproteobacteria bacterium]